MLHVLLRRIQCWLCTCFLPKQRFQIHENRINSLSREDFATLESVDNLDVLNLAHNSIATLQANVFIELSMLNAIDFESNQISFIDDNAFNGLQGRWEHFIH